MLDIMALIASAHDKKKRFFLKKIVEWAMKRIAPLYSTLTHADTLTVIHGRRRDG